MVHWSTWISHENLSTNLVTKIIGRPTRPLIFCCLNKIFEIGYWSIIWAEIFGLDFFLGEFIGPYLSFFSPFEDISMYKERSGKVALIYYLSGSRKPNKIVKKRLTFNLY